MISQMILLLMDQEIYLLQEIFFELVIFLVNHSMHRVRFIRISIYQNFPVMVNSYGHSSLEEPIQTKDQRQQQIILEVSTFEGNTCRPLLIFLVIISHSLELEMFSSRSSMRVVLRSGTKHFERPLSITSRMLQQILQEIYMLSEVSKVQGQNYLDRHFRVLGSIIASTSQSSRIRVLLPG